MRKLAKHPYPTLNPLHYHGLLKIHRVMKAEYVVRMRVQYDTNM